MKNKLELRNIDNPYLKKLLMRFEETTTELKIQSVQGYYEEDIENIEKAKIDHEESTHRIVTYLNKLVSKNCEVKKVSRYSKIKK